MVTMWPIVLKPREQVPRQKKGGRKREVRKSRICSLEHLLKCQAQGQVQWGMHRRGNTDAPEETYDSVFTEGSGGEERCPASWLGSLDWALSLCTSQPGTSHTLNTSAIWCLLCKTHLPDGHCEDSRRWISAPFLHAFCLSCAPSADVWRGS